MTPNTPDTPQTSPSPRASVTRSPIRANLTRAFSLAPAPVTRVPAITQSRSLPAQPLSQTSTETQADPIPLLQPTRPSSSRSRKSFETEKTVTGRGKAGRFNMKRNVNKLMPGAEIISETESVKDKWKQWNIQHQAKIKKEVSRSERSGIMDIVCKSCRRTIAVNKWFKHRTIYNYCKQGEKYLKLDNFKRDYPLISAD